MKTGRLRASAGVLALAALLAAPPPDAPVADAAMRGQVDQVRALLERGADVNAARGDGMTALHWAAENGDAALAELLIKAGATLDPLTRLGGYTPLHLAARKAHGAVAAALLEADADPLLATSTGATPLHLAAGAGDAATVQRLLERGAPLDARESVWGQTPLMFAAAANRVDVVTALLRAGADWAATGRVIDIAERAEADDLAEAARERRVRGLEARDRERPERPRSAPSGGSGGGEPQPLSGAEMVGSYGGLSALLLAAREGHVGAALALLEGGADIDQPSAGDGTTPLLMAAINGRFDLAMLLLERGADPRLASEAGATPLYAALNTRWVPKSRHPQPVAYTHQNTTYLTLMKALLEAGADPNARLDYQLWFTTFGRDYLGVDRGGATPFWRAAYALDVDAMRLLVEHGADPTIPTRKPAERRRRYDAREDAPEAPEAGDPSGLPPVPAGGPGVYPIHAATGVGFGEGYAANTHRHVAQGWLPAVRYLVEELGAPVNVRDYNGYNAVHNAAARGDNVMILYLVARGADVTAVSRDGQTTADMANGPHQRISPHVETVALLERLGSKNNHNCVTC